MGLLASEETLVELVVRGAGGAGVMADAFQQSLGF